MNTSLDQWKNNLIDFSRRNKLLHLRKNLGPNIELSEEPAEILRKLVYEMKTLGFKAQAQELELESQDPFLSDDDLNPHLAAPEEEMDLAPVMDISQDFDDASLKNKLLTNKNERDLDQVLSRLRTRSRDSLNEQGVNILYVAMYFINWFDKSSSTEDQRFESPLFLIPVSLTRQGLSGSYKLDIIQDEIRFNPTLAYMLSRNYNFDFSFVDQEIENLIEEAKNDPRAIDASRGETHLEESVKLSFEPVVEKIQSLLESNSAINWELDRRSILSLFSFAKLSMYQDLEANHDRIVTHPVIKRISGENHSASSSESEQALNPLFASVMPENIDDNYDPRFSRQILDADSSQQAAIYSAKEGQSFVLEGPPGTGKSQTIANIISEALAQNKKVLFVSEKKAALEVVLERLKPANLDKFCFDLHGSNLSKASIINSLRKSIHDIKKLAMKAENENFIEPLQDIQSQLQVNLSALHTKREPIKLSLYDLYSKVALLNLKLKDLPDLEFTIKNLENIAEKELYELKFFFEELGKKSFIFSDYDSFVWKNAKVEHISYEIEQEIRSNLIELKTLIGRIRNFADPIAQKYFNSNIKNLKQLRWLAESIELALESPFPEQEWLSKQKIQEVKSTAIQAKSKHEECEIIKSDLLSKYSQEFLNLDHLDLISKFNSSYSDDNLLRFLNINYWKDLGQIKKYAQYKQIMGAKALVKDLEIAAKLDKRNSEIQEKYAELNYVLGDFYQKFDTDWEETLTAITWVQKILSKLDFEELPPSLVEVVTRAGGQRDYEDFTKLGRDLIKGYEVLNKYVEFYNSIFPTPNVDFYEMDIDLLQAHIDTLIKNIVQIEDWIELKNLREKSNKLGLGQFFNALIETDFTKASASIGDANQSQLVSPKLDYSKLLNDEALEEIFLRKFYQAWVDKIEIENPSMRRFCGEGQELLIQKYITLDFAQMSNTIRKLPEKLALKWLEYSANPVNQRAMDIINYEMNKKKRHKPIRLLVKEIPNLLQVLKPCWMMSPLSVSQLIESDSNSLVNFDLVIFDEASQIRTEDAIAAIYRGQQLILAGDTNQLPPTNFFNSINDDDEDYEKSSFESVLDECSVFLPKKHLQWHYRSRHEDLIQFSNQEIYNSQLITFPSVIQKADNLGVHFELIPDGRFERGARYNKKEAKRMAEAIIEHFSGLNKDKSLGVIAFSEAQQMAIERELLSLLRKAENFSESDIGDDFFIKNLENVQGDERDFIYFSIGYARDRKGNLSHNFGPLNREGGHRRLNVAITRARNLVKVFSSISSADIDLTKSNARGVSMLKSYLAYAESNLLVHQESPEYLFHDSGEFHEVIAKVLEDRGYDVVRSLGSSSYKIDIAVKDPSNPNRFILGIETDGYFYKSAASVRDRERLRKQALTGLGWKVIKTWSRDWAKNPEREIEKILSELPALGNQLQAVKG